MTHRPYFSISDGAADRLAAVLCRTPNSLADQLLPNLPASACRPRRLLKWRGAVSMRPNGAVYESGAVEARLKYRPSNCGWYLQTVDRSAGLGWAAEAP